MKKELQKIKEKVEENTTRLDSFEIQFENMSYIRKDLTLLMDMMEDVKKTKDSTREVADFLKNVKWGKKMVIGFIAFLGSLIALALGIKELMK